MFLPPGRSSRRRLLLRTEGHAMYVLHVVTLLPISLPLALPRGRRVPCVRT